MRHITNQAQNHINTASRVNIANLVRISINDSVFIYLTDYGRNLTFKGNIYESGKLKSIGSLNQSKDLTTQNLNIVLSGAVSAEVTRFLDNSTSLMDNEVTIWQAYLDENNNIIPWNPTTNDPFIYFRGKISAGSIRDSLSLPSSSSTITWVCSNDFYDFEQIAGRFTDDASHRGLVVVADETVPSGASRRPEYQEDRGFFHANKTVKFLGKYQTKEERYKLKSKRSGGLSGFLGGKSYEMVSYWETVTREVDLNFNLAAKYIPVIYGVQKTAGLPIFADTEKNNPNSVWVVYAVCEGEIEGFLDIFIDDAPMICYDESDDEDRVCFGRKKINGDTINVIASGQSGTPTGQAPSTHGQEYVYVDGSGDISAWTFHGKPDQTAAQVLVDIAAAGGFYLQSQDNAGAEYWDASFKLLDTAYVVMNFKLTSDRSNIPSVSFEVSGRKIREYTTSTSYTDTSTSILLPYQILDYMTSTTFGPGIPISNIDLTSFIECANVVKQLDLTYEYTWVPYWRYLGWGAFSNDYRYKMQTNVVLDTSTSVFKLLQNMLAQGVMSLSNFDGKYYLSIEKEGSPLLNIDGDLLVDGSITISDNTGRDKYNSVQASIIDPATGWAATAITFYNSTFLAQDNFAEKKMTLVFDYITNYYTARSLVERELKKSRFTREVEITLPFRYFGLLPNDPVTLTYDRYGFVNKKFLVSSVEYTSNAKYSVVLKEYEDDVFINSNQVDNSITTTTPVISSIVLPARNLSYVPETARGQDHIGINGYLEWDKSNSGDVAYYSVYISGQIDPVTVLSDINVTRYSLPITNLPSGTYTFEVRAVNTEGYRSKAISITVNINSAYNLSAVTGFAVTNVAWDDPTQFVGGYIDLVWDAIPEETNLVGITYNLEVYSATGVLLRNLSISGTHNYEYTLAFMKDDYKLLNGNKLGIYREYNFKIRAEGPNGSESVSWTTIG